MSTFRFALLMTLLGSLGCGTNPSTPAPKAATQPATRAADIPTVEVAVRSVPTFEWSIERTLVEYLESHTREDQRVFEIERESGQRVGVYPVDLVAGDYKIQPNVVSQLHPGMSADFFIDLPGSPSTPFVVVRGEDGYRISVDRTNRLRKEIANDEFRRDNGLDNARLIVKLLELKKTEDETYEADLQIINASNAPIEQFEISISTHAADGADAASSTVRGASLDAKSGDHFTAEFETMPATNVRVNFRLLKVDVTLKSGETFDAKSYFRVTKPRNAGSVAFHLFCRQGFHAVGVDLIAQEAGGTRQTLDNHLENRDALVLEVIQRRKLLLMIQGVIITQVMNRDNLAGPQLCEPANMLIDSQALIL